MAKELYEGIGGTARKAKELYIGVNGSARKIKKAYVGVDGKARLFWDNDNKGLIWIGAGNLPISRGDDIAYGNGRFVVVSEQESKCAYSDNGIAWITANMPSSGWNHITYGGGKFIAAGYNKVAYSNNGVSWSQSNTSVGFCVDICYGNGKFIMASSDGNIFYGTDGITWYKANIPELGIYWSTVAYGNGKFVALRGDAGDCLYSTDGMNWKKPLMAVSQSSTGYWDVVYGSNYDRFVATPRETVETTAYYTDSNSMVWDKTQPIQISGPIAYGNGKYVIVPISTRSLSLRSSYSVNGYAMQEGGPMPYSTDFWQAVCYGNGKFVAVSYDGKVAYALDWD